jgi:predicted ATP-grasp superfamily ATP-dependent carboligase
LGATGLSAVQSLGRKGIPVVGFTYRRDDPGLASRFCRKAVSCPDPVSSLEPFLQCLLEQRALWTQTPVLIPAEDSYIAAISERRSELAPQFRMNLSPSGTLETIQDKRRQFTAAAAAGVPIPQTFAPANLAEVRAIERALEYPAFVKGAFAHVFQRALGAKGFLVQSPDELRQCYEKVFAAGVDALVQSVVEGPASSLTSVCVYYTAGGELAADFAMRKVRQSPHGFGVGTMVETVCDPEVSKLGRMFCEAIGYTGIAEIEFKRGARDGVPRLMELNPRLWEQAGLATAAGVDFPHLLYLDLHDRPLPPLQAYSEGIRWADLFEDLYCFRKNRQALSLSPAGFLRSWRRVRVVSALSWDDPGPFLIRSRNYARQVVHAAWRRLRRGLTTPPMQTESL